MKIKIPMEIIPYLKSADDLICPKSIRSYGTFVKVFCDGENITIVSTDSYRLKEFKLKFSGMEFGNTEFNLSKAEIASIAKGKSDFDLVIQGNSLSLSYGTSLIGLTHNGIQFPSYKAVIPAIASAPIATLNHVYLGGFFPAAKGSLPQARMYREQDSILFMADFLHGKGLYLLCSIKEKTS